MRSKNRRRAWFLPEGRERIVAAFEGGASDDAVYQLAKSLNGEMTPRDFVKLRATLGYGPQQRSSGGLGKVHPERRYLWKPEAVKTLAYLRFSADPQETGEAFLSRVLPLLQAATGCGELTVEELGDKLSALHLGEVQLGRVRRGMAPSKMSMSAGMRKAVTAAKKQWERERDNGPAKPVAKKPVQAELLFGPAVKASAVEKPGKRSPTSLTHKATQAHKGRQCVKDLAVQAVLLRAQVGDLGDRSPTGIARSVQEYMAAIDAVL